VRGPWTHRIVDVPTIAIGDIHGNVSALNDVLGQIRQAVTAADTVVFLGDYIDRGPDSRGCIEAVLRFQAEAEFEVVCLLGNHEDWLLRTLEDYTRHSWILGMEAFDTVRSYSPVAERTLREAVEKAGSRLFTGSVALPYDAFFNSVPREHLEFFAALRLYHQTADCICTHGGLDPFMKDPQQQSRDALIWGAGTFPYQYDGDDLILYGHHNNAVVNADGWPTPKIVDRTIGIDTISHGVLTAIRLPDRQVFQSARCETSGSGA